MADEKEERKKEEQQNGDFCSGISRLHERLGANFEDSFAVHK